METLKSIFNNRELALYFWGLVFVGWFLFHGPVRASVKTLFQTFFHPKLFSSFLVLVASTVALVYLLWQVDYWSVGDLKETITWFFGVALVMFVNSGDAWRKDGYYKKVLKGLFTLTVFLEFLANMYVFPLWVELICFPVVALAVAMKAFSENKDEYKAVERLFNAFLVCYGLTVVGFSLASVFRYKPDLITYSTIHGFLLSPILTVAILPFFYLLALYAAYEFIHCRMRVINDDERLVRYAARKIVQKFHVNLAGLRNWDKRMGVIRVKSKEDINRLLVDE
ncbi:MAG: hypothetical protein KOO63_00210 [Bacteroidales bacterium]|nr:hypothetical protein [Candidatus Latescibacterota bacterium]